MSVETIRWDRLRAHVKVSGDVDLSTGAPLWAVLDSHLAAGRRFLRVDLSEVTFLDATALTGLTRIHSDALAQRGTVVLTGVGPRIARLIRLAGLDGVLLVSGPRADDDTDPIEAAQTQGAAARPRRWSARPVPWNPPGLVHRVLPLSYDR